MPWASPANTLQQATPAMPATPRLRGHPTQHLTTARPPEPACLATMAPGRQPLASPTLTLSRRKLVKTVTRQQPTGLLLVLTHMSRRSTSHIGQL